LDNGETFLKAKHLDVRAASDVIVVDSSVGLNNLESTTGRGVTAVEDQLTRGDALDESILKVQKVAEEEGARGGNEAELLSGEGTVSKGIFGALHLVQDLTLVNTIHARLAGTGLFLSARETGFGGHSKDLTLSVAVTTAEGTLVSIALEARNLVVFTNLFDLTVGPTDLSELSVGELSDSDRHEWFL
jgi:hypothetical protein